MDDEVRAEGGAAGGEAVSWIEAALQAGLGADGGARPDLARQALREARGGESGGGEAPTEAWLEAIAAELDALAVRVAEPGPGGAVRAVAARMRGSPAQSRGAHARIESDKIGDLVRRT